MLSAVSRTVHSGLAFGAVLLLDGEILNVLLITTEFYQKGFFYS